MQKHIKFKFTKQPQSKRKKRLIMKRKQTTHIYISAITERKAHIHIH